MEATPNKIKAVFTTLSITLLSVALLLGGCGDDATWAEVGQSGQSACTAATESGSSVSATARDGVVTVTHRDATQGDAIRWLMHHAITVREAARLIRLGDHGL